MKFSINLPTVLAVSLVALLTTEPALAQSADGWEQPAVKLIELFESGLVKIGALLIGVGIIGLGAMAALSGKIEWSAFGYRLIGGLLVIAGPTMIKSLLEAVG
ncbi:MAG: TrbC/VirB2 family protein [Alphaproteobacteria bacterium]|nr:TrbC/VirB2 family protein [Rhodospirillales bacterium]MCW9045318.1 TrbC/VirB2 family protein [Alphaproteobacteria bacterium]